MPTKSEIDVLVRQVFHTLRSATKAKAKQVKKKTQLARVPKKSVPVETMFDSDEEEIQYNLILLNVDVEDKWKPYQQRGLII